MYAYSMGDDDWDDLIVYDETFDLATVGYTIRGKTRIAVYSVELMVRILMNKHAMDYWQAYEWIQKTLVNDADPDKPILLFTEKMECP